MSEPKSFWELSTGAQFLTTWDDFTKKKMPFVKRGEATFSRPGGKRVWTMFRPTTINPVQMVIPV